MLLALSLMTNKHKKKKKKGTHLWAVGLEGVGMFMRRHVRPAFRELLSYGTCMVKT